MLGKERIPGKESMESDCNEVFLYDSVIPNSEGRVVKQLSAQNNIPLPAIQPISETA